MHEPQRLADTDLIRHNGAQTDRYTTHMDTNNTAPEDEVMCQCSGTRRNNIQSMFEQGMDMDAISNWTGALTGCGGCEWDIADFLKELAAQEDRPE